MTSVCFSFEKLGGITADEMRKEKIKPGYEHINVNMIFDIDINM